MTRKIAIGKGYRLKDGKLVPCYKHLPANLQLQKRASKRVRVDGGRSLLKTRQWRSLSERSAHAPELSSGRSSSVESRAVK
jgi:hypothetical protein